MQSVDTRQMRKHPGGHLWFLVNSENFKFFCNSCKGEPITDEKEPDIDIPALKKEIVETI